MENFTQKLRDKVTFEKVLANAMRTPGVKIDRAKFLKKELLRYCSEDVIEEAVKTNPAKAGISKETVNEISLHVINYETAKVTSVSALASLPGGAAAVVTTAADITNYFVFVLRAVQELAYLYGFEQFEFSENDLDSETMNYVLVFIGVMFGVQGSTTVLKNFANTFAKHVSKKLAQKTLTKGTFYPIVKKVALSVGVRMTKQIFANGVAKMIPVLGAVFSGGLTYSMFKPGCMKLREQLMSYNLCDPEYYKTADTEATDINTVDECEDECECEFDSDYDGECDGECDLGTESETA